MQGVSLLFSSLKNVMLLQRLDFLFDKRDSCCNNVLCEKAMFEIHNSTALKVVSCGAYYSS